MRYVAAYMLATLGGNKDPSEADLKRIITSVNGPYDTEQAKKVVSELSGKDLQDLITDGSKRLATIPSGGGAAAVAAPVAPAEEKKEEKKEEEEEEDDGDLGFSLFD